MRLHLLVAMSIKMLARQRKWLWDWALRCQDKSENVGSARFIVGPAQYRRIVIVGETTTVIPDRSFQAGSVRDLFFLPGLQARDFFLYQLCHLEPESRVNLIQAIKYGI